jgi:hypothetical protein
MGAKTVLTGSFLGPTSKNSQPSGTLCRKNVHKEVAGFPKTGIVPWISPHDWFGDTVSLKLPATLSAT